MYNYYVCRITAITWEYLHDLHSRPKLKKKFNNFNQIFKIYLPNPGNLFSTKPFGVSSFKNCLLGTSFIYLVFRDTFLYFPLPFFTFLISFYLLFFIFSILCLSPNSATVYPQIPHNTTTTTDIQKAIKVARKLSKCT